MATDEKSGWIALGVMGLIVGAGLLSGGVPPVVGSRAVVAPDPVRDMALKTAGVLHSMGTSEFMSRTKCGNSPENLVFSDKSGEAYIDVGTEGADVAREIIHRTAPTLQGITVSESAIGKDGDGVRFTWRMGA